MPQDERGVDDPKVRFKASNEDAEVQIEDAEKILKDKSLELRKFLKDVKAVLEEWKFSVEETKEGMRVELRAVALIRYPKRGKGGVE